MLLFDYQLLSWAPLGTLLTNFITIWPQDTWIKDSELITENEVRDIMRRLDHNKGLQTTVRIWTFIQREMGSH